MTATSSALAAASDVAWLRRGLVAEALDGMLRQGDGVIWLLDRGDDEQAERALGRAFDFARAAATAMRELRGKSGAGGAA